MTRRNDIFRWGAALTALAYVLGWSLVFAHNVTEQHVVCLEHGDLVHASEDGHDHASTEVTAEVDHHSVDAYPTHEDHEHCAIGPFLRDDDVTVTGGTTAVAAVVDVEWSEPLELAQWPRPPPISALTLAPKTSPPHHA